MFKIGDFSTLNKISIKTLRYYDKLGILVPIIVDDETGYRYYSAKQLPRLNKILVLKDLGFSLKEISKMLDDNISTDTIISVLNLKKSEIRETIEKEQNKFCRLQTILKRLNKEDNENMLKYNVILKEVEAMKVASIRDIIPDYTKQHSLWQELNAYLNKHNTKTTSSCFSIYYDPSYTEKNVDVEVVENILGNPPETTRIKIKEIPTVKEMACVIHKGNFDSIYEAYTALQNWIEDNNYKIIGPNREVYLEGEWSTKNPNEYITEVQIPVEKLS